jgi:hypothetical protein
MDTPDPLRPLARTLDPRVQARDDVLGVHEPYAESSGSDATASMVEPLRRVDRTPCEAASFVGVVL